MTSRPRLSSVPSIRRPTGSFRLVGLAGLVGAVTGLMVVGVQEFVVAAQRMTLGFAAERRIVLPERASSLRIFVALAIGAILITLLSRLILRWKRREPIDAVEANALNGGTMTWFDAVAVVLPILASVCFGASVGTEAAVTQIGAVMASQLGRTLNRPRSDLRVLVGAGAAAAIAAAYRAPIAGMLYAYELVLGTYSKRTLAPIGFAAVASVLTTWFLTGQSKPFSLVMKSSVRFADYPLALMIGVVAAGVGIGVMLVATAAERVLKRLSPDGTVSRILVGALLTLLALRFPAVLGSGHAAIERGANGDIVGRQALGLLGAKSIASAASLGAGFRGGLFSASLMIGALMGQVIAWLVPFLPDGTAVQPELCAIIGMAAVGASVIGSPLAMVFLVLETTGDFDATVAVAVGAVTAAFLTDRLFGYSFATWRFQQRGLAIEGGQDVSRLTTATIADVIRAPGRAIAASSDLSEVVRAVSTAGGRGTAVYRLDGSFMGLVDPRLVEVAIAEAEPLPIVASDLVYDTNPAVTPRTTVAEITALFRADDRPTVAVVDEADSRRLIGCVRARDAFALASTILDAQRSEDLGIGRL